MKARMFDTSVQELKYKVLKEVATLAYEDRLQEGILDIPETIVPGMYRAPVCEQLPEGCGADYQP